MSTTIPLKFKIIILVLVVLFLLVFNPFGGQVKNKEQNDFDTWLSASSGKNPASINEKSNSIYISLSSNNPTHRFKWELKSSGNGESAENIQRLLRQAREASIFELDQKEDSELTLQVIEGGKTFTSRFDGSDIESNVKAVLFFKLFEQFVSSSNSSTKKGA